MFTWVPETAFHKLFLKFCFTRGNTNPKMYTENCKTGILFIQKGYFLFHTTVIIFINIMYTGKGKTNWLIRRKSPAKDWEDALTGYVLGNICQYGCIFEKIREIKQYFRLSEVKLQGGFMTFTYNITLYVLGKL